MTRMEALQLIAQQATIGELVFPTNVTASLKIQQSLDDPDCDLETAAKLIITEPLLAARAVAIANSVAYARFGGNVSNVKTAVSLLGFRALRSIVASVVVRQVSGVILDPNVRSRANRLWEHSAHVGALAHVIARRVSNIDAESAMFAGIVHEVGGFYVLSRVAEFPALLESQATENDTDERIGESPEQIIGRAVLKKLMVPKPIIAAIEALWEGTRVMPPETLADTLLIANDLAHMPSPLDPRSPATILQQASEIDFSVGTGTLSKILEESDEEVKSLIDALIS